MNIEEWKKQLNGKCNKVVDAYQDLMDLIEVAYTVEAEPSEIKDSTQTELTKMELALDKIR